MKSPARLTAVSGVIDPVPLEVAMSLKSRRTVAVYVVPARLPVTGWLIAPPSDQLTKCQRVRPFGATWLSLKPTVWLEPSSSRSRKTLKLAPSNWMTAAESLARTTVSEPNRSRKDIVRSVMSWRIESTATPANEPSKFFSAAGLVRNTNAVLPCVPGYGSPASPRFEQPRNIEVAGQKFEDAADASRLPKASAWISSSP